MIKEDVTRQQETVSEYTSESFNFHRQEVGELVYGSKENYELFKKVEEACGFGPIPHNQDRLEAFRINLERGKIVKDQIAEHGFPGIDYMSSQNYGNIANGFHPTSVGHAMFEALVRILGTEEQNKKYLQDILDEKIIGWYAQTEIGHGSDIQSLETRVVYDPQTEMFTVNTPSITAIKFWPGELGKMSNYVVFHGRLISKNEDKGVHAFFCQIRDSDSRMPLKGIEVGDIGPKFGYISKDNGYLIFHDFKIPRESLLSRFTRISKEGEVTTVGNPKVAYSVMLSIRCNLLKYGWVGSFKMLVIRYYRNF
jgi:acyl-CoA oxidase